MGQGKGSKSELSRKMKYNLVFFLPDDLQGASRSKTKLQQS